MNTHTDLIPADLREALRKLKGPGPVLVASDFDGTLAEIVEDPDAARPVPGAIEALANLADAPGTHALIVSGRGLDDLRRLAGSPPSIHLVASHGAEWADGTPGATDAPDIDPQLKQQVAAALEDILTLDPGLQLETKAAGFALHFRRALDRAAAAAADRAVQIATELGEDSGVRVKHGKEVVELTLTDATKGKALASVRNTLNARVALFLGDDKTDEEGFAGLADNDITVKVGQGDTIARHRVISPAAVVAVLEHAASLRD